MSSQVPPKKNSIFVFEVGLVSQADTNIFLPVPTIVAGDVQVSGDGGALGNIINLPTEIGTSGLLVVTGTAAEMNYDRVDFFFHDATGSAWQDILVTIHTVTDNQIDDLSTPESALIFDWTGITGTADRSTLNAQRFLRNKWSITGSTVVVTEEDDATTAWEAVLTSNASADPVVGSDPT